MKNLLIAAIIFGIFYPTNVYAISKGNPLYDCKTTPEIENSGTYLGKDAIYKTNDLRRKTGSGFLANGQNITIKGRVTNKYCLPIADALVEIWQADSQGKSGDEQDPHFAGSGKAYTDNNGYFTFFTVLPASISQDSAPAINLMISQPEYKTTKTMIFFPEFELQNKIDRNYSSLLQKNHETPVAERHKNNIYIMNFTLNGTESFKNF